MVMKMKKGEKMNNLINRQDVLDVLRNLAFDHIFQCGEYYGEDERQLKIINAEKAIDAIELLPSAQPERKWISVTEALPENDDWVIVSIYDDDGDTSWQYTTPGFYVPYGKCWIVDNEYCKNVIAWMSLPKPYSGDES